MDIPSFAELTKLAMDALKTNQFFQGGAVLGIMMASFNYIKSFPFWLWTRISRLIFYSVNIEETDELFYYFELWLAKNHKSKYRNVEASLALRKVDERIYDEIQEEEYSLEESIYYKQFDDTFLIRRGINYIRINKDRLQLQTSGELKNAFYNKYVITGIFSKRGIDRLIKEVHEFNLERKKEEKHKSIDVKSCDEWGNWSKQQVLTPKPLDKIYLNCKDEIVEDIRAFGDTYQWYKDNYVIYKRGLMFHGLPGNGKTSLILSLAKELKRSVNFLGIASMDDNSLRKAFRNLSPDSILVIEDIDAAFKNRDGKKNTKFTFSTLLNCLDGVFSKENVITIFTSNHPELLDPALIREGRIDKKFEFKNPDQDIIRKYLSDCFGREVPFDYIKYQCKLPMVNVQNILVMNREHGPEEVTKLILESDLNFKIDLKSEYNKVKEKKKKKVLGDVMESVDDLKKKLGIG